MVFLVTSQHPGAIQTHLESLNRIKDAASAVSFFIFVSVKLLASAFVLFVSLELMKILKYFSHKYLNTLPHIYRLLLPSALPL